MVSDILWPDCGIDTVTKEDEYVLDKIRVTIIDQRRVFLSNFISLKKSESIFQSSSLNYMIQTFLSLNGLTRNKIESDELYIWSNKSDLISKSNGEIHMLLKGELKHIGVFLHLCTIVNQLISHLISDMRYDYLRYYVLPYVRSLISLIKPSSFEVWGLRYGKLQIGNQSNSYHSLFAFMKHFNVEIRCINLSSIDTDYFTREEIDKLETLDTAITIFNQCYVQNLTDQYKNFVSVWLSDVPRDAINKRISLIRTDPRCRVIIHSPISFSVDGLTYKLGVPISGYNILL